MYFSIDRNNRMKKLSTLFSFAPLPEPTYPLTLYYDASSALCNFEMTHFMQRNAAGKLRFVDFTAASYSEATHGFAPAALGRVLHAVDAGGKVFRGLDAVRLAYRAAGYGALVQPVGWPLIHRACEWGYQIFAAHRPAISRVFGGAILAIEARRNTKQLAHTRADDGVAREHVALKRKRAWGNLSTFP
jgi:predicted DCC family thiol-disulfide oxidoreductase YuxK